MKYRIGVIVSLVLSSVGCTAEADDDWRTLEVVDDGELIGIGECQCTHGVEQPVCGRNGVTYESSCFAACDDVEVAFEGGCGTGTPETRQSFDSNDCILSGLAVFPEEDGHLSAVRLPIENEPFKVTSVRYSLVDNAGIPGCDASLPQLINFWVQDNDFPDATPQPLYSTVNLPNPTPGAPNSFFTIPLPEPIVLDVGESLFVSFSMDYVDASSFSCVLSCNAVNPTEPGTGNRGLWSNSATAPYPWVDLGFFGLTSIPVLFADGERLTPDLGNA